MTLRETIEAAVNTVEEKPEAVVQQEVKQEVKQEPVQQAEPEQTEPKVDRTAGRQRDEHGRLLPGKAQKSEPQEERHTPPPPSSWKKDHWESWNKIATENPTLADYLNQREGEFAKGVSTYKQEYENIKPLAEAMQPFLPTLQQNGVDPAQWIQSLGNAHHRLVYGSPQEKLQMFAKLAQDYQVPLQALYDPQVQQQFLMQQTLQPQQTQQPDVRSVVREQILEAQALTDLERFQAEKDANGNTLYPHYETVRDDMALLLERGKVNDLKGAYDMALRLHDDIWAKEQEARQVLAQNSIQAAQTKQVNKAKAAAVSPKTTTPGSETVQKPKGIRSAVEAAVEAHAGGGRV